MRNLKGFKDLEIPQGIEEHVDSALPRDENWMDGPRTLPNIEVNSPEEVEHLDGPVPGDDHNPDVHVLLSTEVDAAGYRRRKKWKRQRRQRGKVRVKDHRKYLRNRHKILMMTKRRYKKLKNNPQFNIVRKRRLKNPKRYKRRRASDNILFAIGHEFELGWVTEVTLDGDVLFDTEKSDGNCLPATSFLSHVVFFSEEDLESMFELLDKVPDEMAYSDLEPDDIHGAADLMSVPWDDDEHFMDVCEGLVGKRHLDDMTPDELEVIDQALIDDQFAPSKTAFWRKVRKAGELFLYDQGNDTGSNPLDVRPDDPEDPTEPSDIPQVSDQGFPPRSTQVVPDDFDWPSRTKSAATIKEILFNTGEAVKGRSGNLEWKLKRADPRNGIWTFRVKGSASGKDSKQENYQVRVKGLKKGNVRNMSAAHVQVSCTCKFFQWQGPEHWAKANKYLYGKPAGTATRPEIKDPKGQHWACKHVVAVLQVASNYRLASTESWRASNTVVEPSWGDAEAVADRWLSRRR